MTKKDYVAIARIINSAVYARDDEINGSYENIARGARWAQQHIAEGLAEVFAKDNPDFKRDRFMSECGFTEA